MAVRIALRRSREDSARPTEGSVQRDSIASAQHALGSSRAGSSRSRRPENLSFPITGRADYESHRERTVRRGKERIRAAEARIAAEMEAAEAADVVEQAPQRRKLKLIDRFCLPYFAQRGAFSLYRQ